MPQGLQVFDAQGRSRLFQDRTSRVLGVLTISANGSLSDPGLLTGNAWYALTPRTTTYNQFNYNVPLVSISGSLISWSRVVSSRPYNLIYGVF